MFLEIWSATDMIFSHFGPTSPPLSTNKTQNFEKMKKMPENIIISHKCSINDNHMHDFWDMKHNKQNFLSFWAIFCPFTSLTDQNTKMKKKKKKKAPRDIIILHKCSKNHNHMLYCSWDMPLDESNYFPFWAIFCPFTLLTAKKI